MTGPLNAVLNPPTRPFRRGFVVVYISLDSGDRVMVFAHVTGIIAARNNRWDYASVASVANMAGAECEKPQANLSNPHVQLNKCDVCQCDSTYGVFVYRRHP